MKLLIDSFWRAVVYCLHPRVIGLSLLPLVVGVALALGLGWLYWESAVAAVRASLEQWQLVDAALRWVETVVGASFRSVIAPLIVVALALPLIVVVSVLLVALTMMPAIVALVHERRFPTPERRHGAGIVASVLFSLGCTLVAGLALLLSLPLWLVPPLVLVLPPLIWGWLTFKVMSFDALAAHASAAERRALVRAHRWRSCAPTPPGPSAMRPRRPAGCRCRWSTGWRHRRRRCRRRVDQPGASRDEALRPGRDRRRDPVGQASGQAPAEGDRAAGCARPRARLLWLES